MMRTPLYNYDHARGYIYGSTSSSGDTTIPTRWVMPPPPLSPGEVEPALIEAALMAKAIPRTV